jgi:hypothetical protein
METRMGMVDAVLRPGWPQARAGVTGLWSVLAAMAVAAPLVFVGLDLARALGALILVAAAALLPVPVAPLPARAALALGPAVAALVLLVHPLEGVVSPPTVLMAALAWAALAKAVLAARAGPASAAVAMPFLVSAALLLALLAGWACGRFWLLATFVGLELASDARLLWSVSPGAPPRG